jgi:CHASE3 domain sensor protein
MRGLSSAVVYAQEERTKIMLKALMSRSALAAALPVVMALLLSGVISFSYNRLLKDYRDAVDHTFEVISTIDNALLRLQDAETGQRGFIITGDESYLAPFEAGRTVLFKILSDLHVLVPDNADQQARVASLRKLAESKLNELEETIITRKQDGFEPARTKVLSSAGKETMDRIRSVAAEMRTAEGGLLESRLSSARFAERMMIVVAVICVVLSLAGRILAFLIRARMQERTRVTESD